MVRSPCCNMDAWRVLSTFLSLTLLGVFNGVHTLSISTTTVSPSSSSSSSSITPDLLDLAQSVDIESACPSKDTFCVPRVKCPVKNVVYDRESLRFILADLDRHGCGAFAPTWTYVCCSTLDKADAGDWSPKPDQWFLPPSDGAAARTMDVSDPFPVMAPWPGHNMTKSNSTKKGSSTFLSDDDKTILKNKDSSSDKQQPSERSVMNDVWSLMMQQQQTPPFPSFMMNDPRLNPWMNPNAVMNRAGFFPRNNFQEPWMMQQLQQQQMWSPPHLPDGWTEMILIFPDGSTQHTFRDARRPPISSFAGGMMDGAMLNNVPESFRRPGQTGLPPLNDVKPVVQQTTPVPDASSSTGESSRVRRAATFKLPTATGGMWTGNATDVKMDMEGRALLPKPNAQWGQAVGSGPAQTMPVPPAFNVNSDRCGLSASMGINARVLSGRKPGSQFEAETSLGEFPWHAAVVNGETGDYLCAGTIISARFVLTVAHCVRKFQMTLLFVRVGDWDLSSTKEMFPSYDVEVSAIQIHEDYYAGNLQNDIAILQLKYPLDFSLMPHVGTICLPPSSDPIYSDCIVTGWGQQVSTSEATGDTATFSRTLKQTSQTLVTAAFCEKSLRPFLGQFYQLPKKGFVCAYDKDGKDSCFGDGGGALACLVNAPNYPKPTQYHVVGLVSWGVGCGMPAVPSAYTAVWDYLDWIRTKVSQFDPYPMSNPDPLNRDTPPSLPIMVRAGSDGTSQTTAAPTTVKPTPKSPLDFIDLAFRN